MATSTEGVKQTLGQAAAQTISGNNIPGNTVQMPNGAGLSDTGTADQTVTLTELVEPQLAQLLEAPTIADLEARILQRIVMQFEAMQVTQQAALQSAASASAAPQVAAEAPHGHSTVPEQQAPDSQGDTDAWSQWQPTKVVTIGIGTKILPIGTAGTHGKTIHGKTAQRITIETMEDHTCHTWNSQSSMAERKNTQSTSTRS